MRCQGGKEARPRPDWRVICGGNRLDLGICGRCAKQFWPRGERGASNTLGRWPGEFLYDNCCMLCLLSFVRWAGRSHHTHTSGKCDVGASHKRIVGHDEASEDQHGPGQLGVHPGRHWRGRKGAGQESTRTEQIVLF